VRALTILYQKWETGNGKWEKGKEMWVFGLQLCRQGLLPFTTPQF
jgi:hypothetical protein